MNNRAFPVMPILGLIFITLKLTHYIDWSWWWVLCPFWIGLAIIIAVLVLWGAGIGLLAGILRMVRR
jgi:Transmembrane Fragile-X-F protein